MKNFIKKITGIEAKEQALEEERNRLEESELELLKKKDPKEFATRKKEPYIAVIDTHVNKENIRNGFFELDWNEYFVEELKQAGYGFEGDPEEEIVDRWFRDIVGEMLSEDGLDPSRGAGFINVNPIDKGRSEVS